MSGVFEINYRNCDFPLNWSIEQGDLDIQYLNRVVRMVVVGVIIVVERALSHVSA